MYDANELGVMCDLASSRVDDLFVCKRHPQPTTVILINDEAKKMSPPYAPMSQIWFLSNHPFQLHDFARTTKEARCMVGEVS